MNKIFQFAIVIAVLAVISGCANYSQQNPSDSGKGSCQMGVAASPSKKGCCGVQQGCGCGKGPGSCPASGPGCQNGKGAAKGCAGKSGCSNCPKCKWTGDMKCPGLANLKEKCAAGCQAACARLQANTSQN